MRENLIKIFVAALAFPAFADVTLQLQVKQLPLAGTNRPFGDVGRFEVRNGDLPSLAGECPGNTNLAGKVTCRFVCKEGDQATSHFKIIPPRTERTRGYTSPGTKEVTLQGCQLSVSELEFIYVDITVALRELTKDTPLAIQFAEAGASNWNGKFDAASETWSKLANTTVGRQKLDQIRTITGELALDRIAAKENLSAANWDNFSVGISNVLLKESAIRNYGNSAGAKIVVSGSKADLYKNLSVYGDQIEAKPLLSPIDARRLSDVNNLKGTTSDRLPRASFRALAVD